MEFKPEDLHYREMYKLLIGAVQPRPIAWVSTLNADGTRNLAPYSFFTVVCPKPPTLVFCPNISRRTRSPKDTLQNIRETGEYVVNIVTEANVEKANLTSVEAPSDIDEFDYAGVTALPSTIVKPPRVAESPIHFECKLKQIVEIGDTPGEGSMVIGTVVHIHIDDACYVPGFKIDTHKLRPVGRMAGSNYTRALDIFDLPRPDSLFD